MIGAFTWSCERMWLIQFTFICLLAFCHVKMQIFLLKKKQKHFVLNFLSPDWRSSSGPWSPRTCPGPRRRTRPPGSSRPVPMIPSWSGARCALWWAHLWPWSPWRTPGGLPGGWRSRYPPWGQCQRRCWRHPEAHLHNQRFEAELHPSLAREKSNLILLAVVEWTTQWMNEWLNEWNVIAFQHIYSQSKAYNPPLSNSRLIDV